MKRILLLIAVLLAAVTMAVSAEGFSLELGGIGYDFNALSAQQAKNGTSPMPDTNSYDFSLDPYFNGSYVAKLNGVNLKLGLMGEDIMGTISPTFVQVGRIEPYVEASANGLTFRSSFPMYFLGFDAKDTKNNEIKYIFDKYYKGVYLSTFFGDNSENSLFTNYESLSYKLAFDKTFAMVFSASTEIGISPTWIYDVKPQISFIYGPLQLDVKESIYFADAAKSPSFSDTSYNTRYYTDPKLSFDFGSIGVKGLKAYVAASIFTADVSSAGTFWYGQGNSKFSALGSSITPGVSFTTGPLYIEVASKISNYDDSITDGITNKNPTWDPMVKVSYTLSF